MRDQESHTSNNRGRPSPRKHVAGRVLYRRNQIQSYHSLLIQDYLNIKFRLSCLSFLTRPYALEYSSYPTTYP